MASIAYPHALTLGLMSSKAALLSALRLSMMAILLSRAAMTVNGFQSNLTDPINPTLTQGVTYLVTRHGVWIGIWIY